MRYVFMALTALSAVALSAEEADVVTTGGENTSEVVSADETSSGDEESAN